MASPTKKDFGNSLDLVDIQEIKENAVILKDGSLRQVIMVGGVNFALKSETEQNIIIQAYQTFLNGIDFPLQILIHSRKVNIDRYVEGLLQRKDVETSPILQNQIDEYAAFVRGFVEKNAIMEKVFLAVVPFYPPAFIAAGKSAGSFLPFLGGKKKSKEEGAADKKQEGEQEFKEHLAQINQRTSEIMNGILLIGLEATLLEYDALVELFYNFYNPQTIERQGMPAPRE
jgi:type IV secretory pathway VirB4 component